MAASNQALTEKEKQTLRLLGSGYDAKSMARHLGLSVHTVNERLREARRKMATSSSREAARQFRAVEDAEAKKLGDEDLGEAAPCPARPKPEASAATADSARRPALIVGGIAMSLSLVMLACAALSGDVVPAAAPQAQATSAAVSPGPATEPALKWLTQVDAFDWAGSYEATSHQFKTLNTLKVWANASELARHPLGAVISRQFVSEEWVPAAPAGERLVRFRTTFANKAQATETIPLVEEAGTWKVVGYIID